MNSLREPRIPMQLRVEVHGTDWQGLPYQESTFTANISRTGTRLSRATILHHVGERVELRRGKDKAPYSVIWIGKAGSQVEGNIGLRLLDPVKNIWGVPLPPPVLVSSDREWAELSAGLPSVAPVDETEQSPAEQSAASAVTFEENAPAGVAEISFPVEAPEAAPESEAVSTPHLRESRSLDEAFARLQSERPAESREPAATLEVEDFAVTAKLVAPEPPAPVYPEQSRGAFAAEEPAASDEPVPVFNADDDDNQTAPAELPAPSVEPDTVTYGPQFLPAPQPPAAKPFYQRPVVYLGLGTALLLLLVFSWTRIRTVPTTPPADAPVSASTSEPAAPPAPVQQTQTAPTPPQPAPAKPIQIEEVPQSPKAQTATPAAPAAAGNFAVQVGAYESAETAQALANSLGSRYATQGVVDPVQTASGKTLHRVRLIAGSQADAKALAARVRRERAFDAIVVRVE